MQNTIALGSVLQIHAKIQPKLQKFSKHRVGTHVLMCTDDHTPLHTVILTVTFRRTHHEHDTAAFTLVVY